MKMDIQRLSSTVVLTCLLTLPASAEHRSGSEIIAFDAPGADATANAYNGTYPTGINAWGVVTGYYIDSSNVYHGFLRNPSGKFRVFEVPGADTTAGSFNGTLPNAINDFGQITGNYSDANGAVHGFLRSASGKFTSFDVPGAGGYSDPIALNLEGAIVGYYLDANSQFHAFLRKPNGTFASFDGPDACDTGTAAGCYGSAAFSINLFGKVAAGYEDNSRNFVDHALVRRADGKLSSFEAPGAGSGQYQGTGCPGCAPSINDSGAIAGTYIDSNNVSHGYLRDPDGSYTTFDAPLAGTGAHQGTGCPSDCAVALNDFGDLSGTYIDGSNNYHGYFRNRTGEIHSIDPTGATDTFMTAMSDLGVVTGFYLDANNVYHGFLRIPARGH